jgi:hypothetical protein
MARLNITARCSAPVRTQSCSLLYGWRQLDKCTAFDVDAGQRCGNRFCTKSSCSQWVRMRDQLLYQRFCLHCTRRAIPFGTTVAGVQVIRPAREVLEIAPDYVPCTGSKRLTTRTPKEHDIVLVSCQKCG